MTTDIVPFDWDVKEAWGEGPWLTEPDRMVWVDEATGLDCMILRAPVTGALCGYVGVPPGHPLHGKPMRDESQEHICEHCGYDHTLMGAWRQFEATGRTKWPETCDQCPDPHRYEQLYYPLDVHGGVTYSAPCDGGHICHIPGEGRPHDVFWIGFDCAHAFDLSPKMEAQMREYVDQELLARRQALDPWANIYRDIPYVQREVTNLARQLKEMES